MREKLIELIKAYKANDKNGIENAYRFLERVGMDRLTARIVAEELMKTLKEGDLD